MGDYPHRAIYCPRECGVVTDLVIRPGTPGDLAAIASIQAESGEAAQWAPGDYLTHTLMVAEVGGCVVAFTVVRPVAGDEWELLNIAVTTTLRRRGVGRRLLAEALRAQPATYFLEVRESNRPARKLYESLGFEPVGIRQNYYSTPPEAAIVMRIRS